MGASLVVSGAFAVNRILFLFCVATAGQRRALRDSFRRVVQEPDWACVDEERLKS
jgi:hypothetical protein